jgi:hypothetical protein
MITDCNSNIKIRQLFFFFLQIVLLKMSSGQSYIHFPDSNAVWHETWVGTPPPQYPLWYHSIGDIYYHGDTIINNKKYHKLYSRSRDISCSSVILSTGYLGALREDTISQKVYGMYSIQNQEYLLYDFNLQPGDIIPNSGGAIVNQVLNTITSDGVHRRVWTVLGGYHPSAIIEGIGGTHGLLSNMLIYEYPDVSMCFEGDNKQTVYINYTYGYGYGYCNVITDTCNFLSTNKIAWNELLVYPNPIKINSIARIKLPGSIEKTIEEIFLINQLGQKLSVVFQKTGEISLITPNIPGIYLLQLRTQTRQFYSKKIIIN